MSSSRKKWKNGTSGTSSFEAGGLIPEGNANDHATSGVLDILSLPSGY